MSGMFNNASSFNQDLSGWNVGSVSNMSYMFQNASSFDQSLATWPVSNVTNASAMFSGIALSTANYDATLIAWSGYFLQHGVVFSGGNSIYCTAITERANIISTYGWTITDGGVCTSFITTWKTNNPGTSGSTSITIPTTGSGYNYDVDWNNDGTFDEFGLTGDVTHNFGAAGTYTIRIRGAFPRIYFAWGGDRQKLLNISQWGNFVWESMEEAFAGCTNLTVTATDAPNLSHVTSLSNMFYGASSMNSSSLNSWNVTLSLKSKTELLLLALCGSM
jgi:surface protein